MLHYRDKTISGIIQVNMSMIVLCVANVVVTYISYGIIMSLLQECIISFSFFLSVVGYKFLNY